VAKAYSNPITDFKTLGHFRFSTYLKGKQIYNRMYIPPYWWKMIKPAEMNFNSYSITIRNKIDSIYKLCKFPVQEQTVLSALMLGVRTEMSADLLSAYSRTGAMHILAVSGLHVGILYLVLSWILFFMKGKILEILKGIIIVCCIWFYAFMTGFSPSIERAAIMFSLFAIARQMNDSSTVYNTLAGTALISLLLNPLDIFDIGFQLTYLAIIGIVYFSKKIDYLYSPRNKWAKKLWELLTVSLSAQFLTLPLTMYYFGQFPLYFLITNSIAIPLSFVVMVLGILIIPCLYISHTMFSFVAFFLGKSVWLQNMSITKIASLPYASLKCSIPLWGSMLLFCIIATIMIGIERKRFN
jgi:competence protein ComEC